MRTTAISLISVCLAATACQRLDRQPSLPTGPLKIEFQGETVASIPAQYGDLVAVSPLPEQPFTQVLWFVQPDKTLVAVRVNVSRGALPMVMTIPRR